VARHARVQFGIDGASQRIAGRAPIAPTMLRICCTSSSRLTVCDGTRWVQRNANPANSDRISKITAEC
jgi:hypothetical protein